jgi:transcriptional regulator with XRE-family HTH domain
MTYSATTTWTPTRGNLLLAVTIEPREVGARLKAARERRGLTQLEFALEANVSPSSVARWEAGKLPPIRELMRLADLLEIDAGELVENQQVGQRDEIQDLRRQVAAMQGKLDRVLDLLASPDDQADRPAPKG